MLERDETLCRSLIEALDDPRFASACTKFEAALAKYDMRRAIAWLCHDLSRLYWPIPEQAERALIEAGAAADVDRRTLVSATTIPPLKKLSGAVTHRRVALDLRVEGDVEVVPDPHVAVSIDCYVCQRRGRTVYLNEQKVVCSPSGHAFPGHVISQHDLRGAEGTRMTTVVDFAYVPFKDRKRPDPAVSSRGGMSSDAVTWARLRFVATCPRCGAANECFTQTNYLRETWSCGCGQFLFPHPGPPSIRKLD